MPAIAEIGRWGNDKLYLIPKSKITSNLSLVSTSYQNLSCDDWYTMKLLDFGKIKDKDSESFSVLTKDNKTIGVVTYKEPNGQILSFEINSNRAYQGCL